MSSTPVDFLAEFTAPDDTGWVICQRPACSIKVYPPGTQLQVLESYVPGQAARSMCVACINYYTSKITSRSRGESTLIYSQLRSLILICRRLVDADRASAGPIQGSHTIEWSSKRAVIQAQTAKAQRGGKETLLV